MPLRGATKNENVEASIQVTKVEFIINPPFIRSESIIVYYHQEHRLITDEQ
jgi:hypothetical protein